jgi:hypothetical protein
VTELGSSEPVAAVSSEPRATPGGSRPAAHGGPQPPTGDPRVDAALGALSALDDLPVDRHAAVFEAAHDRLREVLTDAGTAGSPA